MSRATAARQGWDFGVRFYYGIRAKPPKQVGALAIETVHKGDTSKNIEVVVGKRRKDIGRIAVLDFREPGGQWLTIYREANT